MILISFEGCDGVGKSTQCKKISHYLHKKIPDDFIFTSESHSGLLGKKILKINNEFNLHLHSQIMLWLALRIEHWQNNIRPLQKKLILYDRFIDSTLVYQAMMHGHDPQIIHDLHQKFALPMPALTVLLVTDEQTLINRINRRYHTDQYDSAAIEVVAKRQQCYLKLAKQDPDRIKIVDTGKLTSNQVTSEILTHLHEKGIID